MVQPVHLSEPMVRPRYDVRFEPCIPALTIDPVRRSELGVAEVLERADTLGPLPAGASPGETLVLVLLLLAVLYEVDHVPTSTAEWRDWVGARQPLAPAAEALRQRRAEDWDLFDEERPLGQNADLRPFLNAHGVGHQQLVLDACGDYQQFTDLRHLHHDAPMTAAQALRHMLVQHAFGPYGRAMIPGSLLGPRLTNQALGYRTARLSTVACGATLGDTLRLNLAPVEDDRHRGRFNTTWTDRTRRKFTGPKTTRAPEGHADVNSWLGRSILLRRAIGPDGELHVDKVLMGGGEVMTADVAARYRQDAVMVAGRDGPTPVRPRQQRGLWRESPALYAAMAVPNKGEDLLTRVASLPGTHVDLWSVGLLTDQTMPVTWLSDTFPYTAGRHAALHHAASTGHGLVQRSVKALGSAAHAAWLVAYPNPKPGDKQTQIASLDAGPDLWAAAEEPFHQLLEATNESSSAAEPLSEFTADLHTLAADLLRQRLALLPPGSRGIKARAHAHRAYDRALDTTAAEAPVPHQQPPVRAAATAPHGIDPALAALLVEISDDDTHGPEPLVRWLYALVATRNLGALASLRRFVTPPPSNGMAPNWPKELLFARRYAPTEDQRPVYGQVAYLFALYHQGASRPSSGHGSLGTALRRIGIGERRGPNDPGVDRLMQCLLDERGMPEQFLRQAVTRLRSQQNAGRPALPPSWVGLISDLTQWQDPQGTVRERWGRDFYTPTYTPTTPTKQER